MHQFTVRGVKNALRRCGGGAITQQQPAAGLCGFRKGCWAATLLGSCNILSILMA